MNWKPLFAGLLAAGLLAGCASNVNTPATLPAIEIGRASCRERVYVLV